MTRLLLDFDSPTLPRGWFARLLTVCRTQRTRIVSVECDRTRHGWHVIVVVSGRWSLMRIVAAQAIIGSDWRRESHNLSRAVLAPRLPKFWRDRSNVLYAQHIRGI